MKSKAIIPLILGLAVGVATVKLAINTIRKAQAGNQPITMVQTVRAKQDIDPYNTITAEMVEVIETPASLLVPDSDRCETLESVLGRVSAKPIPQFAPVLQSMLAPEGTLAGMVGRIPEGYRAVSVRIDEVTGVAFQISPGDWVDVIVVMDVARSRGAGRDTIAEVILQNVQVAAIGYATASASRSGVGKIKPAKSVTLMVAEAYVPKLHLASTRGKITLAMRGHGDSVSDNPASATLSDVISALRGPGSESTPAVAPQRGTDEGVAAPHEVVVYHGVGGGRAVTSIERITFAHDRSTKIVNVTQGHPSRGGSVFRGVSDSPQRRDRNDAGEEE